MSNYSINLCPRLHVMCLKQEFGDILCLNIIRSWYPHIHAVLHEISKSLSRRSLTCIQELPISNHWLTEILRDFIESLQANTAIISSNKSRKSSSKFLSAHHLWLFFHLFRQYITPAVETASLSDLTKKNHLSQKSHNMNNIRITWNVRRLKLPGEHEREYEQISSHCALVCDAA